ncbi:hypothetical protein EIP91_012232 [Steccherinum ochraceum]|uniref:EF-hand domain-containing protein n=1 Tax=Steccherinum ochraceum TaxID=92696 RepID=A0A4R0RKE6_9APHY|nr:hypothetical protein EIP91_012232 [Steccherinum ochraceum]
MVLSTTCRDGEGWGPVSSWRQFDLTPCFEEGILLSSILVIFIIVAAFRCFALYSLESYSRSRKSLWVLWFKLAFLILAAGTSIANLVLLVLTRRHVALVQSYILEILSLVTAAILTYVNHWRTRTSSSVLLILWPFYISGLLVWARTVLDTDFEALKLVLLLKSVITGLVTVSFLLECYGPELTAEDRPQSTEKGHVESPLLTANIFSIWSFGWMGTLMKKGAKAYITEDDLPSLVPADESENLGAKLQRAMEKHKSLWVSLSVAYGGPYILAAVLKISQDCLAFLQPQLLRWLLNYISTYQDARINGDLLASGPSKLEGFAIAILMFIASVAQTVILHQYFQRCFETGMRVRAGLVTAIYKKALILSNDGRGSASGDIVNLMSVDATRMQDLCTYGLIAISGPFQITLAFISLYGILGWPAFVGVAIMIFSIPLNTIIARALKRMQEKQMKNRDQRTRLMSELLYNIKSIKLYAWENAFIRKILTVRNDKELAMLRKIGVATSLNGSLWTGIPLLVAFSSFATAALTSDTPLTSDRIFPAISLFMLLQFPLAMISQVTSNIIEAMVSVKRLSTFLQADELQEDARELIANARRLESGDEVLSITNGEFYWTKDAISPTLEDINLSVKKGELVGILGRVGAGKTSLMSAIIGEMRRTEGTVKLSGCVAYAPQTPWIMSVTVKDNIIFSHEFDESFYNIVLDACALRPDLALMPQGDMTEVGEKGITLSGGQRARISLARAVYARADLTILDDVLAAVDSHVARHVFDHVIGPQGILATKARILVTNSISFLRQFDQVVYLRRGLVLESGSYDALISNEQSELYKLVKGHGSLSASGVSTPFTGGASSTASSETAVNSSRDLTEEKLESVTEKLQRKKSFTKAVLSNTLPVRGVQSDGLTKEHTEQGRVKKDVYFSYIEAASKIGSVLFVITTVLVQISSLAANNTLRSWGEHNRESGDNKGLGRYLLGYGLFSLGSTLTGALSSVILWVFCSIRSSKHLHDNMLQGVMRAPMSFFEQTPTGRILNLFSRDIYVVDSILARVIQNVIRTLCTAGVILWVIGYSFPLFLVAVPFLGWFYVRVMIYYLATSRELKRLDAVSRSPIFAWFSESLNGLSTIRAFNQQDVFAANNARRVDRNQICYLPSISVNRWLAVRLELVGATIIFVAAMLAISALITTGVDAGLVGFVLSYALNATGALNWLVRSVSEVEQNVVSVERILHYTNLEPEAPAEIPDVLPEQWPTEGAVEFKNYSTRYRSELDLVLRDISLNIQHKEKIGICGRTGSGKSSLLLSLFRIIEPAAGTIYIDGVDITKIGLHDLRSAISIVPQSPDLFEGTIRENIDPTGAHQDAEIWVALEQSHLKQFIESLPEGLDAPVREGGSSLSSGQRQLLCFARALLRKSKILVLDEATSAVDLETDKAIQTIIRGPQFEDVTMFTIAHRLNTILESDRVLVLDAGKVAEFDSPKNLLAKSDSSFYSLALEAGLHDDKRRPDVMPSASASRSNSDETPLPTLSLPKATDYAPAIDDFKTESPVDRDDLVKPTHMDPHDSDSDSTATGTDDEFDWEAADDAQSTMDVGGKVKAKRGRAIWGAFMKLSRFIRTMIVGAIGAGILITPLLVFKLRFNSSPARIQAHVWSLWLTITWGAAIVTYLVVDGVPWFILHLLHLFGYSVERLQTSVELTAAVSGWLKLALDSAWLWIALAVIRANYHPPGDYWTTVNRVVTAIFAGSILLLAEKVFLRYVAINFHRKALAERLAENRLGLEALDRLSNAQPSSAGRRNPYGPNKRGHKSLGSLDMLGFGGRSHAHGDGQPGSSNGSPVGEKGHRTSPSVESNSAAKKIKISNVERRKRRRNAVAAVLVDGVGGAIGQVALKDSKLNRAGEFGSLASAGKLARKLFSTLSDVHPPRSHLLVDDFVPYFKTTADAQAAFALFDKDGNGDISKREMREAVRRIYRERKALTASLKDVSSAIGKLDAVVFTVMLFIFIFICLLIFNRNNTLASLVPLATIILGFSFIFGHSAQTLFESLIFIFSTHVFDVGDLVMIDDSPMFVREFGLFSTTFRRVDGAEIIAPNALLNSAKLVHNLRRSNSMWETTNLMVSYDTPLEVIEQLRIRLQGYIALNNREWSGLAVNIDRMEYQNAIILVVAMEHRPNWQDWGGRWGRRTAFMRHLKTVLEELDVKYTLPIQPVLLPGNGMRPPMSPMGAQGSPRLRQPPMPRGGSIRQRHSRETLSPGIGDTFGGRDGYKM